MAHDKVQADLLKTSGLISPKYFVYCGLIKRTPQEESGKMKKKRCSIDR
jgi:hypothetical protein